MKSVILLKGLPGCGKTTFAHELLASHPGEYKRVNKDELRAMIDASHWSGVNEKFVLKVRDYIILEALKAGKSVIVDDTNLHPKHETHIRQLVAEMAAVSVYEEFEKDPRVCIERDLKRPNSVGSKVIMGMYNQFMKPKPEVVEHVKDGKDAIICDLDGTLCLFGDKNPYERDFENDTPNKPVLDLLYRIDKDNFDDKGPWTDILFVSGRTDKHFDVTRQWLDDLGFKIYPLFMRLDGDARKDSVVKKEIFEKHIKGNCNIQFVIDDRNQVVEMWRSLGLTVFQVADGDF